MSTKLDYALAYASQGWACFPCHHIVWSPGPDGMVPKCSCGRPCTSPGKHPRWAKAGTHAINRGHKDASTDPDQIRAWWGKWPEANIGIATGEASGLTVLDIDGPEGHGELIAIAGTEGPGNTLAARTGSGAHLYYQWSGEHSSARGKLHVRGEGGFVIAPPSNHKTGRNYEWLNSLSPIALPDRLKNYAEDAGSTGENAITRMPSFGPKPEYLKALQPLRKNIAETARAAQRLAWSPDDYAEIETALATIDPDMKMLDWLKIGMALHSLNWERSDGTDAGEYLWDVWSSRGKKYKGAHDINTRWRSFRRAGVNIGTLFFHAQKAGWIRARVAPATGGIAPIPLHAQALEVVTGREEIGPRQLSPAWESPAFAALHGMNGHASVTPGTSLLPAALAAPQRPIRWIDRDEDGKPRPTCTSAMQAIQHMGVSCTLDVFHEKMTVAGHAIQQWAGDLSDNAVQMLRHIIKACYGFDAGEKNVRDASVQLCLKHQFNPVTDYLDQVQRQWDGTPRIGSWLAGYLDVPDSEYAREVGRLMLLAAVRRARQPGCKFDQIIVLEGPEGTGKSAAIEILAGRENFSDQRLLGASDKEQQEAMAGVWLYELAELEGMRRTDVERIKQFASRTEDRARPAYGRMRVDRKRTCIFVATTNEEDYLKGTTGNRRFWPVRTGRIELDSLARDRNQLWAEAAYLESTIQGVGPASIGLDQRLWKVAAIEQHGRLEEDAWQPDIEYVLGRLKEPTCSISELLKVPPFIFGPDKINHSAQSRVARILVKLGWEKYRQRTGNVLNWRYRPRAP